MPLRILQIDDSVACAVLLRHWLEAYPDLEWVGAARTAQEGVEATRLNAPDVVVIDTLDSPYDDRLPREIRAAAPDAAVIVYSGYVSVIEEGKLCPGADAYVAKGDDEAELIARIRDVAERG